MNFSRFSLFPVLLLCLGGALGLSGRASWALLQTSGGASAQQGVDQLEQEPGDDVYRHSASVKFLGRGMHLDKETAAEIFEYLNFALLAGGVLYGLLQYLPKTFRAKREDIQHRLLDARTATEKAHERLAAIEQRLARLDEEIAAISKQAEKDSLEDEARIKASIEDERRHIVDAVSREIALAGHAAQRDLKRFAAGLAVDRALQRLVLTEDDDRSLMQEFVQKFPQSKFSQAEFAQSQRTGEG